MNIVVDTSVARAAGHGRADAGPPSPACVAALDVIDRAGLRVATSTRLKDEWNRQAQRYAQRWLAVMFGRRRVDVENSAWEHEIALIDAASDLPGNQADEVAKDSHLVGLAMLTDRRVLSLDVRQRTLLARVLMLKPVFTSDIAALHWVSPTDRESLPWLQAAAPDHPTLQLSTYAGIR